MFLAALLLLLILLFNPWFLSYGILTHGDWLYFYAEKQIEFLTTPQIWSTSGLGSIDISMTMYPIMLAWGALSNTGFGVSERVLYMIPSLLGSFWGSYLLLSLYFKNKYAKVVGVLVYTLNTYFMVGRTGHLTLMVGFALAPFIFYYFHKFLQTNKKINLIFTILISIIAGYYEFRAFYLIAAIVGIIGLYAFIIERKITLRRLVLTLSIYFFTIFAANLFWILPFQMTNFFSNNEITGRTLFGNGFMRIDRSFGLFHPFWSGGEIIPFQVQRMPITMWILPMILISSLIVTRKKTTILLYGFIALMGVFLAKQSNPPFSTVYELLYNHSPGFSAFREASKFYFYIALGYSVVIAGFAEWIFNINKKGFLFNYGKYLLIVFIAGLFMWNTKPIITGEIGTLFVTRTIHNDYKVYKDYILKDDYFYRSLWVPVTSRWSIYTNNKPIVSLLNTNWTCEENENCTQILDKSFSDRLLDIYTIRYLVVPIQDIENDDDFFQFYGYTRQRYIDEMSKLDYLKRIDIGTEELVIYENQNYKPHVYISSNDSDIGVNLDMVNTSHYKTQFKQGTEDLRINFTNSYHPDWKLRFGEFNWIESLTNNNYFYPDEYHIQTDVGLNAWEIDPKWLQENGFDTDESIPVTIYFAPQAWTNVGLIISGATFASLLLALGYFTYKDYVQRKK